MSKANTPAVQAMIMAGGRGERLRPLTAVRPKPAVPFGGVFRIVDFTLSNCLNSGLEHVSLLTQYKHESVEDYIRQSWSRLWSEMTRQPLDCLPPQGSNRYRGTADAVFQNLTRLPDSGAEFVLILSADHVYHMDYRKLLSHHVETKADFTIATVEDSIATAKQFGVVDVDSEHRVTGFQEKPATPHAVASQPGRARINMGVYLFKREVLLRALNQGSRRDDGYDFGHHVIPSMIGTTDIRAYDFRDEASNLPCYWRDIGTVDNYYETSMDLVRPQKPFDPYASDNWPSHPARYPRAPASACLNADCNITHSVLSPGVRVENGSSVTTSVLMSGAWIGTGAKIRRAIIEEGVHIPAGMQIGFDLQDDRKNYFVTDNGVVVVTRTPEQTRPISPYAPRQASNAA